MGGGRLSPIFFLVGILIFLLVRSPCKISEPYDNPFWEKSLWWVGGGWWWVCKPIVTAQLNLNSTRVGVTTLLFSLAKVKAEH